MRELAVAMKVADGIGDEDLHDIDFNEIRDDIIRFGKVFSFSEYEVNLSYAMYDYERASSEELETSHAWIASLCLRYLSFPGVRNETKKMCDRYSSVAPTSRPRQDLISYAVKYWPKHYKCAGAKKPMAAAKAFFQDGELWKLWAQALHVWSNPMTRITRRCLSPLPIMAMAGLDDLLVDQIEAEKPMASFSADTGLALIQAAHNGHAHIVRLLVEANSPSQETLREAMLMAVAIGDEESLNHLINISAKLDSFDWPPMLFLRVAWLGLAHSAQLLLNAGAKIPLSSDSFKDSVLHIAAETRNSSVMKLLLPQISDVDVTLDGRYTPLHYAAVRGDADTVQMLVNAGANINASYHQYTPVNLAIQYGKHLALEVLLKAGANINIGTDKSYYEIERMYTTKPIIYAAILGYTKCVRLLINHGADITAVLDDKSALWYAVSRGHLEICRLLLKKGADPGQYSRDFESILEAAMSSILDSTEKMDLVELLITSHAGGDDKNKTSRRQSGALAVAAKLGNQALVNHLLRQGVSPDGLCDTQSPLYLASFHGHADIVELLINGGAAVDKAAAKGWTSLHAAYDNPDIVKILLSHGASIDIVSESGSIIHLAAKHNKVEVMNILLQHRPRPNLEALTVYETHEDMTPLCIACILGHAEIMRLLLQNGANINYQTRSGKFPLMFCINSATDDNISAIQTLLEFRPDIKSVDSSGNTGLHLIQESTPLAVVRHLYTAGFDAQAVNNNGETVLSLAISKNRDAAKFFISKGVDINTHIPKIGTALNILATAGDWELFNAAIDSGADINLAQNSGLRHTLLCSALSKSWDNDRQNIVEYLLTNCGISPDEKCEDSNCSYAILKGASMGPDALRLLIQHGADIEAQDAMGRRALHIAAFKNSSCVQVLLDKGADLQPETVTSMVPLHFASASGSQFRSFLGILETPITRSLTPTSDNNPEDQRSNDDEEIGQLKGRSRSSLPQLDFNVKDSDDWTPLMWAAKNSYMDDVPIKELLQRGADPWARGKVLDGKLDETMLWSALKVSRYFGARQYIYDALVPSKTKRTLSNGHEEIWNDAEHQTREAFYHGYLSCSYCMTYPSGINYKCKTCEFNLCYKCFRSNALLHPGHTFGAEGQEFAPGQDEPEESAHPTDSEEPSAEAKVDEDDADLSPEAQDDEMDYELDEEDYDESSDEDR
ncbi:ankyrin repeat-containing domain protein [Trichoderma chlorosporum]